MNERYFTDLKWLYDTLRKGGKTAAFYEAQAPIIGDVLNHLISAQIDAVPVVHGHWIYRENDERRIKCSCCFVNLFTPKEYRYCPSCGAKMDEPFEIEEDLERIEADAEAHGGEAEG